VLAAVAIATVVGCGPAKPREMSTQERTVQGLPPTTDIDERYGITGEPLAPETAITLPATSKPVEWLTFKVRNFGRHRFAIDPDSVTQGSDGIVRYSLLVRTKGGVDNITYEGIRCATNRWKLYAIGRDNGEWSRLPAPVWRPVVTSDLNAVRYTLASDYACDRDGVPFRNAQMVAKRIRASNDGRLDMTVR